VFLHQRKLNLIKKTWHDFRCAVNIYNAGVVTQGRRIGSRNTVGDVLSQEQSDQIGRNLALLGKK
jgi:hypothetical protein